MAIQPMALAVQNPEINAVQAMSEGRLAGQQQQSNQLTIAKQAMQNIGSLAFGVMGGKIDGQADPQLWEQSLDMLAGQGMNVDQFRGRADLAPIVARASVDTLGQMNNNLSERELEQRVKEFTFTVSEAAKGPKPTSQMQNLEAAGLQPGSPEFQQGMLTASGLGPDKREIRSGPDGVDRYVDTGKPVFPGVEKPKEPGGASFDVESKLRSEYQGGQGYKDFIQQEQAYQRVLDSAKEASPAGDLALIFNYMKVLDPGSVVRESEFATAAASGSFGERIQAAVDQVISGKRLSSDMRRDFLKRAGDLFSGASTLYGGMNDRYSTLAGEYGVEPTRIVRPGAQIGVMNPDFSVDTALGPQEITPPAGEPARPMTDADYSALPSGALFVDPDDGQTYRKP